MHEFDAYMYVYKRFVEKELDLQDHFEKSKHVKINIFGSFRWKLRYDIHNNISFNDNNNVGYICMVLTVQSKQWVGE